MFNLPENYAVSFQLSYGLGRFSDATFGESLKTDLEVMFE